LRKGESAPLIDANGLPVPAEIKALRFNLNTPSVPNGLNRWDWGRPELYWTVTKGAAGDGPGTYITMLRDCYVGLYEWQRGAPFGAPHLPGRTLGDGNQSPGLLSLSDRPGAALSVLGSDNVFQSYGVKKGYRIFFGWYDLDIPDVMADGCVAIITLLRDVSVNAGTFPPILP
jgi:hypothetical protein